MPYNYVVDYYYLIAPINPISINIRTAYVNQHFSLSCGKECSVAKYIGEEITHPSHPRLNFLIWLF